MEDTSAASQEPPRGVTFEEVWAMIRETDRQMKETDRRMEKMRVETDRRMEKMRVEADRRIKETDRQLKKLGIETDRRIGNLGNSLGDVIEHLMSPKLHKKFKNLGFIFDRSSRDVEIRDRNHQDLAEIDVFLENGDYAMAVEVKTRLTIPDIKEHLERMEILRQAADERKDQRKYLGAVAGASVNQNVLAYALKNGLYVIIPSGETVDIEAPGAAGPRIW